MFNVSEYWLDDIRTRLTKRETQIFNLFGEGMTPEQVGVELHISRRTVESHRDHIKGKLGVPNTLCLYQLAYRFRKGD